MENNPKSSNFKSFNTWDYANEVRTNLPNQTQSLIDTEWEEAWQILLKEYNQHEEVVVRDLQRFDTPFEAFVDAIGTGHYPPPEVLLALAKCFSVYIESEGKISLEEALFGKPKQKRGVWAKQKADEKIFWHFKLYLGSAWIRNRALKVVHIQEAKNFLIKKNRRDDPDSFLRAYRRWLDK